MQFRFHSRIDEVPAAQWDALNETGHPFSRWAFLESLERHNCVRSEFGWQPRHLTAWDGERLVAATPFYIKTNSHGEFVFDWGWADAYARYGLNYYPKTVCAVPYTPVPGPRILFDPASTNPEPILAAQKTETARLGGSSCHWLFSNQVLSDYSDETGLLQRRDIQFHWHNRAYGDFDDFLSGMRRRARKNIRQERRRLREEGFTFSWRAGNEMSREEIDAAFRFYALTFSRKGNLAVLNRSFFHDIARLFGNSFLVCFATRHGRPVAGAIFLKDDDTLYGRYWGSEHHYPFLHFETCYYQGIDLCIRKKLGCFQPGAQGEFKMRRGFEATDTESLHWIADEQFREAIARHLQQERALVEEYRKDLLRHSPYR